MWTVVKAWQQDYIPRLTMYQNYESIDAHPGNGQHTSSHYMQQINHADTQTDISAALEVVQWNCEDYPNTAMQMHDDHYM